MFRVSGGSKRKFGETGQFKLSGRTMSSKNSLSRLAQGARVTPGDAKKECTEYLTRLIIYPKLFGHWISMVITE